MNPRFLLLLIVGHLVTDTCQGALPALLPTLKDNLDLSYAMAGAIIMTMNLTSSVIQPLFGYLTDRWPLGWLLPVGVGVSGLGFSLLGLAPGYQAVLVIVVVCGLGVASYHPEAFKRVLASAGQRKVTAVSWFMVGGNLGMALGPILVGAYLAWLGLRGTLLFALPALACTGLFLSFWNRQARAGASPAGVLPAQPQPQPLGPRLRPLGVLVLAVIIRSWVHTGIMSFLPFYYVHELGGDSLQAGTLLSTFLLSGVAGTLLGAPVADRIGPKRFFLISVALVTPFTFCTLYTRGIWHLLALGLSGATLMSTWSVVMVMAQQILPDRAGMASGLMVGFALGMGGVGAAILGLVADRWGVTLVMEIVAALPLLSGAVAWFIHLPQAQAKVPAQD